ncbi:MAG: glucose-6-phosphate isomerase [Nitrospina sp.]|nr:MAG: glucose-6-phosphate isomerase [Nitrospina sp.]
MDSLDLNFDNILPFVSEQDMQALQGRIDSLHESLEKGLGEGSDYLGWLHLPSQTTALASIQKCADRIKDQCEAFISIGIGGSYLGARAAITFSRNFFHNQLATPEFPQIYFAGQNISSDYLADLLEVIADKEVCINVISKSGTTTEPAIAFRFLKQALENKYGRSGAQKRITVTTDQSRGALRELADAEGYQSFVIPGNVGGRYSVLTPVGLLPIAVAGVDIEALLAGARNWEERSSKTSKIENNIAYRYAAIRNRLYSKGKVIEVMASFHPALKYVLAWWQQLAGESEGKNGQGIFPASVEYTTDLHSLGQWVQEGNRIIFETFLLIGKSDRSLAVPRLDQDADGLNYLAGKSLDFVNDKAYHGTAQAHLKGEVPNMTLTVPDRSPHSLGQLFYFFERAIALSGYLMGVNPFDQPGVEFYKKNMFELLNKPGYEKGSL